MFLESGTEISGLRWKSGNVLPTDYVWFTPLALCESLKEQELKSFFWSYLQSPEVMDRKVSNALLHLKGGNIW